MARGVTARWRDQGVRSRRDITADLTDELAKKSPGVEWAFSQYIRDNVMEGMTGVKGDNCVKIYGPDLTGLEELASKVKDKLLAIRGVEDVGIYRVMGQSNLEFAVDKKKCERFGLQVNDVTTVVNTLVHGYPMTSMVEGEKTFDITLRLPWLRRQDEASILEARVDVWNRTLTPNSIPSHGSNRYRSVHRRCAVRDRNGQPAADGHEPVFGPP